MNALTNRQVGNYLNRHYVSAFQKVATFKIEWGQKQGGNVAAYFCTPDNRVLHAVAGPVDAATFLREARWANETYQMAQLQDPTPAKIQALFRRAHLNRLQQGRTIRIAEARLPRPDAVTPEMRKQLLLQNGQLCLDNQSQVHLLLAVGPAPRLGDVYQVVFEQILGEQISTNPVGIARR